MGADSLTLKWGTLKDWSLKSEASIAALKEYAKHGVSFSAMMQRDTPEQKVALCKLIDALDADTVYLDWDDKHVSKDEARRYVMEYGK